MTGEEIAYVREWARSGGAPRSGNDIPASLSAVVYSGSMNRHAHTIAHLADMLDQACDIILEAKQMPIGSEVEAWARKRKGEIR